MVVQKGHAVALGAATIPRCFGIGVKGDGFAVVQAIAFSPFGGKKIFPDGEFRILPPGDASFATRFIPNGL